jgi:DNA-binding winged helix-turn-helix (wHTH) protein
MFAHSTYPMSLLKDTEARRLLDSLDLPSMTKEQEKICLLLAGGHPGLLIATAQVLSGLTKDQKGDEEAIVFREPQPRAECLKIWDQLSEEEQDNLITLTLNPSAGLPRGQMGHLSSLSLLHQNRVFSPIFEDFLNRKAHGPDIKTHGVYLDLDSGDVWVDGIRIPVLTDLEFRLLALLYDRRDKLTDKYHIVTGVWGEEYLGEVDDARVEKLVSRLRSKIESDPANPRYLITRRGRGYKLLSVPRSN